MESERERKIERQDSHNFEWEAPMDHPIGERLG